MMGAWYTVLCGTVLHIPFVGFTHSLNLSLCVVLCMIASHKCPAGYRTTGRETATRHYAVQVLDTTV